MMLTLIESELQLHASQYTETSWQMYAKKQKGSHTEAKTDNWRLWVLYILGLSICDFIIHIK